jgi:hypothetical protein
LQQQLLLLPLLLPPPMLRSQTQSEGGGWGPKTQTQATAAWFRACYAKQRWWEVLGDGGIAHKEQ